MDSVHKRPIPDRALYCVGHRSDTRHFDGLTREKHNVIISN